MGVRIRADDEGRAPRTRPATERPSAAASPAETLRRLQRDAGNRAVAGYVGSAVVQRYVPTVKNRKDLTAAVKAAWEKAIVKAYGDDYVSETISGCVDDVAKMFDSHLDAMAYVKTTSYAAFEARDEAPKVKPKHSAAAVAAYAAAGADVTTADPAEVANIEAVLVALKARPLPGYTLTDLRDIDTRKRLVGEGWTTAIDAVAVAKAAKAASAAAAAALTAKYAAAKAAGDLIFTGGLVQSVWLASHGVATAPGTSVNATLGGEYNDATILAAVALWDACPTLGAGAGAVTNVHVPAGPGGHAPIQDKSLRPVNPDPDRGRQADFIATWGGTEINIHVDSNVHHL